MKDPPLDPPPPPHLLLLLLVKQCYIMLRRRRNTHRPQQMEDDNILAVSIQLGGQRGGGRCFIKVTRPPPFWTLRGVPQPPGRPGVAEPHPLLRPLTPD